MCYTLLLFFQRYKQLEAFHLAAEIAFVEIIAEYGFIETLQLSKTEFLRQQFKSQRIVGHFKF